MTSKQAIWRLFSWLSMLAVAVIIFTAGPNSTAFWVWFWIVFPILVYREWFVRKPDEG